MGAASSTVNSIGSAYLGRRLGAVAEQTAVAPEPETQPEASQDTHPSLEEYMALGATHTPAPLPPSEPDRQECLCALNVLDTVT
eukprot:scaffold154220_cov44-Prasinocladus_malaysianus.AAC.1